MLLCVPVVLATLGGWSKSLDLRNLGPNSLSNIVNEKKKKKMTKDPELLKSNLFLLSF